MCRIIWEVSILSKFLTVRLGGLCKTRTVNYNSGRDFHASNFKSVLQTTTFNTMQSSTFGGDHLRRTSDNSRDVGIHPMTVKAINSLSQTVKEVVPSSEKLPAPFSFKAGQWVDVFIPSVKTVGGFSMCSSPQEMASFGILRLAIKYSTHPPALWMHEKCQVGHTLSVRVGGDFYLTCTMDVPFKTILLIAGGVGINPLSSMVHYAMNENNVFGSGTRICLLYSAKAKTELIFKKAFDDYCNMNQGFIVKHFVTHQTQHALPALDEGIQYGRICLADLKNAVGWLTESTRTTDNADIQAYICGPPSMITDVRDALSTLNISSVHFEKWW